MVIDIVATVPYRVCGLRGVAASDCLDGGLGVWRSTVSPDGAVLRGTGKAAYYLALNQRQSSGPFLNTEPEKPSCCCGRKRP